ncbi:MAG: MATE family efflux transporter [Pirellulaceae bacterium]
MTITMPESGISQSEIDESPGELPAGDSPLPDHNGDSWWNRVCGGREVIALALPLMVSTFSYSLMQFCDRIFLAWYSPTALAAVLPAGVMVWTLLSFPLGTAMYTNVFVAQYFGAGQNRRIGMVLWHGMILATMFTPIFLFSFLAPSLIFELAGHEKSLVEQEATYFGLLSVGSIAHIYGAVLTAFFIGQGRTVIVMIVDVFTAALNVLLDWLLIFGFSIGSTFVLEPMGIRGAAIATTIALCIKTAIFLLLVLRKRNRRKFGIFDRFRFSTDLIARMFRFGSSNGLQFLLECLGIAAFSIMIAGLGEIPAAATTIAISVNLMVFVPIWGLSTAVSTMVGQRIGDGHPDLAERATWTSMVIGLVYTGFFGLMYVLFPGWFLMGHDAGADDFGEIARLTRILLWFVAAYCIFDSVQIIFVGAIKGAGDTFFVVVVSVICSTLFVVAGIAGHQALESDNARLFWWWSTLTGWIVLLSIIYATRFLRGKWKTMQVIERDLIHTHDEDG